jgi:hypothetical protein
MTMKGLSRCRWPGHRAQYTLLASALLLTRHMLTLTAETRISFCDLPEITEEALTKEINEDGIKDVGPFYKQYRCIFGFVAQMAYV